MTAALQEAQYALDRVLVAQHLTREQRAQALREIAAIAARMAANLSDPARSIPL